MSVNRMTQSMMINRSYVNLQLASGRLNKTQEQLTTGRVLNRPSDSPTDTTSAMRMRSALADQQQYQRNAMDGAGWLSQIDDTLTSALDQVRRARELGIQGVNGTNANTASREALAVEVEQLRHSLVSVANTSYLGRPVFGGITAGTVAYKADGTYAGADGDVMRTVAKDVRVKVNADAEDVFGPHDENLFESLDKLANALRAGDLTAVGSQLDALATAQTRITSALSDVGTRLNRVERAEAAAQDAELDLTVSLSSIEDVDLARATIDLSAQEVAYKAAQAATARLVQPSLADFLR